MEVDIKKEEIIELYKSGSNLKQIAKIYGCCSETVRRRLTEWGLKIRKGGTKEWLDKIREKGFDVIRNNPPAGSKNPRWNGGSSTNYFKQIVLARDGRICQICGYNAHPEIIEVHHKDGNHHNNSPENGIAICPNCHRIEEFKRKTFHTRLRPKRYV